MTLAACRMMVSLTQGLGCEDLVQLVLLSGPSAREDAVNSVSGRSVASLAAGFRGAKQERGGSYGMM